jgi:uncharacterized protein (TIGR02996 family)
MRTCNLDTRRDMLAHMVANPDDFTARLVFADHLEESRVEHWPELIRSILNVRMSNPDGKLTPETRVMSQKIRHDLTRLRATLFIPPQSNIDPKHVRLEVHGYPMSPFSRVALVSRRMLGRVLLSFTNGLIDRVYCDYIEDFAAVAPWFARLHPIHYLLVERYRDYLWNYPRTFFISALSANCKSLAKFMGEDDQFQDLIRDRPPFGYLGEAERAMRRWSLRVNQRVLEWARLSAFDLLDVRRKPANSSEGE